MTAHLTDAQLAEIEARLANKYDAEGVGYPFIQQALRDIAALLQALRAEREEVARLRRCPICKGTGKFIFVEVCNDGSNCDHPGECPECDGSGIGLHVEQP